jgi:hypothetical protein
MAQPFGEVPVVAVVHRPFAPVHRVPPGKRRVGGAAVERGELRLGGHRPRPRAAQHRLAGYAGHERAGPADQSALDDGHRATARGGPHRFRTRSRAENDNVEDVHGQPPSPVDGWVRSSPPWAGRTWTPAREAAPPGSPAQVEAPRTVERQSPHKRQWAILG